MAYSRSGVKKNSVEDAVTKLWNAGSGLAHSKTLPAAVNYCQQCPSDDAIAPSLLNPLRRG